MQRKSETQSFREMCERRGLAVTHQRQIIFETLAEMRGHPSPEAVYDLVTSGRAVPVIDHVFPLAEAATAHARLEAGDQLGKIVLRIPG